MNRDKKHWAIGLNGLNITDASMTWLLVEIEAAKEVNPLMQFLINSGPVAFFGVKALAVWLVYLYLSKRWDQEDAVGRSRIATASLGVFGFANALLFVSLFLHIKDLLSKIP